VKDALGVDGPEQAVLAVLLLRGPQTVAELRTRTERLHPFGPGELESTIDGLATREPPIVERVRGAREPRWRQLVAEEATPVPEPDDAVDRPAASPRADRVAELEARVADLEARLTRLEAVFESN
jgi:uncharacterized protein YceH (UPF0502 family)